MTLEYILRCAVSSMIRGHHTPHCFSAHKPGAGYTLHDDVVLSAEDRAEYLRQLERTAMSEIENLDYAKEYAEPGYTNPARGVLFANWNHLPRGLDTILERAGYAIEWSDEWSMCDSCQRAVRTSADSYSWRRSYYIPDDECSIICEECAHKDLDDYEAYLLNDAHRADTFDVDWSARGFVRHNPDYHYQNGWHPGQNDKPTEIVKHLAPNVDWLFAIPSVGQFDVSFDLWIRDNDEPEEEE